MNSKMVQTSPLPFLRFVISFFIFVMTILKQANEAGPWYFIFIISLVTFWCISSTYAHLGLRRKLSKDKGFTSSNNIRIYIDTAHSVVISYVSLLSVNWSNIWLAVFPLIAIGFILAVCYELSHQSRSRKYDDGEGTAGTSGSGSDHEDGRERRKADDQEAAALVPYWVLCGMRHYHTADKLAISQFLLFFSSMMGALTQMMTQLAVTGAATGLAPASVLLRKATLVVLFVTVHTVAAELLSENFMLFILPEVAPVLLWFSLNLDRRDDLLITTDTIYMKFDRVIATAFYGGAALCGVFAVLPVSMDEQLLVSWWWCTKAMVSCGVSGLLVYYVVFMLRQWPGMDSTATVSVDEAVKLLELWAKILLVAASCAAAVCMTIVGMTDI